MGGTNRPQGSALYIDEKPSGAEDGKGTEISPREEMETQCRTGEKTRIDHDLNNFAGSHNPCSQLPRERKGG